MSILKKLSFKVVGITSASILFASTFHPSVKQKIYSLLRTKIDNKKSNPEFFQPFSIEEQIRKDLKTGDLVLFKRKLSFTRPYFSLMCILSRLYLFGEYDHVGVVVVDSEKEEPFVFECDFNGLKFTSFESRITNSPDDNIAIRLLKTEKPFTNEQSEKLLSMIDCSLKANDKSAFQKGENFNSPSIQRKDNPWRLLRTTPKKLDKNYTVYHTLCIEHATNKLRKFIRDAVLLNKEGSDISEAIQVASAAIEEQRKRIGKIDYSDFNGNTGYRNAELVARVYQTLGVIPNKPAPTCYNVDSFSDVDCKDYNKLKLACVPIRSPFLLEPVSRFRNEKI